MSRRAAAVTVPLVLLTEQYGFGVGQAIPSAQLSPSWRARNFLLMQAHAPIRLCSSDKLDVLRRLDQFRRWDSLDDKRLCLECGKIISGRQIEVVGGTRAMGPLRLQCPTEDCNAIAMDWALPNGGTAPVRAARTALPPPKLVVHDRRANEAKITARLRNFISVLKQKPA